ncbi:MAG TPA: PEP-CTERM sorting domain-containing protein [Gemmatimonadaceae bacterium]|nr:PEP-CTERM sorting domain-containing protein [Gemmatimonadaceae bacterium]
MKRITAFACRLMAAIAMLTAPVTAIAAPIVFEFQGTTSFIGPIGAGLGITASDTLMGSYAFEPTTVDSAPADPVLGAYDDALTSLTVTIGGNTWTLSAGSNFIQVSDNFSGAADIYRVVAVLSGPTAAIFELTLSDATQSAFSSDALASPDLTQFAERRWSLGFSESDPGVFGELTALTRVSQVPEPVTLTFFGAGLAVFLALRRRRRATV